MHRHQRMTCRSLKILTALAAAASVCAGASGEASARPSAVGYYAEAGIGGTGFVGEAARYSAIGPTFQLHVGYDLTRWLAIGVRLGSSIHQATVPPPPQGEYYQLYGGWGEVRVGAPVGRFAVFAAGGAGAAMMSTNVLEKVDILKPGQRTSIAFAAGGGLEYQLENRHWALGAAGEFTLMPQFAGMKAVSTRLYLRYTY